MIKFSYATEAPLKHQRWRQDKAPDTEWFRVIVIVIAMTMFMVLSS